MDTNKMREQFEAAFVEEMCLRGGEGFRSTILHLLSQKKPDGDYQHITESLAWWGWRASREAVVVELPDVANYEVYDQQHDFLHTDEVTLMEAVRSAMEAQGLKVAP